MSDQLHRTKAQAKARPGNSCMLSDGQQVIDLLSAPAPSGLPLAEGPLLPATAG